MSGEALSSEDRAKLDHEVSEFSKRMQAFWKSKADARDWDQVKARSMYSRVKRSLMTPGGPRSRRLRSLKGFVLRTLA